MLLALSAPMNKFIKVVFDKTALCFVFLVEKRLPGNTTKRYCNCFHSVANEYNIFLLAVPSAHTPQPLIRTSTKLH